MHLSKCSVPKEEGLYVLEVFVDSVSLFAERLEKIEPNTLGVDISLVDFPLFRIFQTEFQLTNEEKKKLSSREGKYRTVNFNAGKKYLFAKNPSQLIERLRSKPLEVDVYKVKKILNCPREVVKHPLGYAKFQIPGCLCDQVMMAGNDLYHLPKSYEIRNMFGLIDEEYKPAGYINLLIRLTCYGKSMKSAYSIVDQKLLFKNDGSHNEFLCIKVPYLDENERRAAEDGLRVCSPGKVFEESELDAPPRPLNVVGLILINKELTRTDGFPAEAYVPPRKTIVPKSVVEEIPSSDSVFKEKLRQQYTGVLFDDSIINQRSVSFKRGTCTSTGCGGTICTGLQAQLTTLRN